MTSNPVLYVFYDVSHMLTFEYAEGSFIKNVFLDERLNLCLCGFIGEYLLIEKLYYSSFSFSLFFNQTWTEVHLLTKKLQTWAKGSPRNTSQNGKYKNKTKQQISINLIRNGMLLEKHQKHQNHTPFIFLGESSSSRTWIVVIEV